MYRRATAGLRVSVTGSSKLPLTIRFRTNAACAGLLCASDRYKYRAHDCIARIIRALCIGELTAYSTSNPFIVVLLQHPASDSS